MNAMRVIGAAVVVGGFLRATIAQCPNDAARTVLGQTTFESAAPNQPSGLVGPAGLALVHASAIAIAPSGRIYVSDAGNNRVLSWPAAAARVNGAPADRVFGQPDLFSSAPNYDGVSPRGMFLPQGVWVDAAGALWVCDAFNHRVLRFNDPETDATPFDADLVLGQLDLTGNSPNLGPDEGGPSGALPNSLLFPGRVMVHAGGVYVADSGNSRVLFYSMPTADAPVADAVFGQFGDFNCRAENNDGACNFGESVSADNMRNPIGIAMDAGGRLYVADWGNHRVLRFSSPLVSATADGVFGQPDMISNLPNNGGPQAGLTLPIDLAVDAAGRLLVADGGNNRVLVYTSPVADLSPGCVLGQEDSLGGTNPNHGLGFVPDDDGLFAPSGIAVRGRHTFVVDSGNHRALRFELFRPTPAPSNPSARTSIDVKGPLP